jgi:serralysin
MVSRVLLIVLCMATFGSCINRNQSTKNNDLEDSNYALLPMNILDSINVCTEMPHPDSIRKGTKQASGKRWLFWEKSKKILYVSFIDGDTMVQQKVKSIAKEWEKYCGKVFVFVNNPNEQNIQPDITISFKESGSWSLIGKESRTKVPSMNLGWLTPNTNDDEYRRVVLHEFGHALGLVHEHQNPNNHISWNKENVYAYYKQKYGWTKQTTYYNFFEKYSVNQMNSSAFDSLSIMMYEIPEIFTTNGFHTKSNIQLSEMDKKWIGIIYPKNNL